MPKAYLWRRVLTRHPYCCQHLIHEDRSLGIVPFICTKNSVLILLADSLSPSPLDEHKASISSIKIIEGLFSLPSSKSMRTCLKVNASSIISLTFRSRLTTWTPSQQKTRKRKWYLLRSLQPWPDKTCRYQEA